MFVFKRCWLLFAVWVIGFALVAQTTDAVQVQELLEKGRDGGRHKSYDEKVAGASEQWSDFHRGHQATTRSRTTGWSDAEQASQDKAARLKDAARQKQHDRPGETDAERWKRNDEEKWQQMRNDYEKYQKQQRLHK